VEPALIGLLGVILGVLLSNLLARALEIRRRFDRETDLIIAIHAEIVAGMRRTMEQTDTDEASYAKSDDDPFAMSDRTDFVFESIKADPAVLPKEVIHSVVRYYKLAAQSNAQTDGLLTPQFKAQNPSSRRKYVGQLLELLVEQEKAGRNALEALEQAAAGRGDDSLPRLRDEAGIALDKTRSEV